MKRLNYVIYLLIALVGVACLFAPYLIIDGTRYSVIETVQNFQVNGVFATIFVAFGLYFCSTILLFFLDKSKWVAPVSSLFFIASTVLFAASKPICKAAVSCSGFSLAVAPVLISICSLAAAINVTRYIFDNNKLDIRDIAEIAIFVSFAFVLDLPIFKLKVVANGGSVSLVMLPLILLALRKGFFRGLIASGIVFGLVSCFLDGYGFITYPLDYLLGFGSLAVVGLFRKFIINQEKINWRNYLYLLLATLLAMSLRTLASTISGILIYGLDFGGSLIYQLTYMGPSFVAVGAVLVILLYPLNKLSLKK